MSDYGAGYRPNTRGFDPCQYGKVEGDGMTPYQKYKAKWSKCRRCELCDQRSRVVLCRGKLPAPILFVGEAPGASEDVIGKPFCGPAGHLLNQIIERALDGQWDYCMTNLVACYPRERKKAGINEPAEEHIETCSERLVELVRLCQPQLLVLVGKLPSKYVPSQLLEKRLLWTINYAHIPHPAAILRMEEQFRQDLAIKRAVATIEDAAAEL